MIREAQLNLIHALKLESNSVDFERCSSGILGCETLKEQNRYAELELNLNSVENLRQQYQQEKEKAFNSMKEGIQKQVEQLAQQAARQAGNRRLPVDIRTSVEASVKASSQWRSFISEHEKIYGQSFKELLAVLDNLV